MSYYEYPFIPEKVNKTQEIRKIKLSQEYGMRICFFFQV